MEFRLASGKKSYMLIPHHHPLIQAFNPIIASFSIIMGSITTIKKNHTTKATTHSTVVPNLTEAGGRGNGLDTNELLARGIGGSGFNCWGGSGSGRPRRWDSEGLMLCFGKLPGFGGTGGPS